MLEIDILLSLLTMALIFYRQIGIYKDPYKLNYAPLMLSFGAIASLFHFLIMANSEELLFQIRESLIPLFVGSVFFAVMNVLHQKHTKERERSKELHLQEKYDEELSFRKSLLQLLHNFETKMLQISENEKIRSDALKQSLARDMHILENIQSNQLIFITKIEKLFVQQESVLNSFENFSQKEMPNLDQIIHTHIDILRISEKDHYNKVVILIENLAEKIEKNSSEVEALEAMIAKASPIIKNLVEKMVLKIDDKIGLLFKEYTSEMQHLKSQSEAISLSLSEYENHLTTIKDHTALFLKQTVLASNRMEEIAEKSSLINQTSDSIYSVIEELHLIQSEYKKSRISLEILSDNLSAHEKEEFKHMREQVESLTEHIHTRFEDIINDIKGTYHLVQSDLSPTVQKLSLQNQDLKFKKSVVDHYVSDSI